MRFRITDSPLGLFRMGMVGSPSPLSMRWAWEVGGRHGEVEEYLDSGRKRMGEEVGMGKLVDLCPPPPS